MTTDDGDHAGIEDPRLDGMASSLKLPPKLSELVLEETATQNHIGESKSDVYRVRGRDRAWHYLKISVSPYVAKELERETEVLSWLLRQGVPVPRPVFRYFDGRRTYFLMSEVPGSSLADLASTYGPAECMRIGARFLARLHSTDISQCPFDRTFKVTLSQASEHCRAGMVDEEDFDEDHRGKSARELLDELTSWVPTEDLVFTHGDYCFPNIICLDGQVSGVVDLGRAGIADRYQDIGLFLRSFRFNVESPDLELFLREYGLISSLDLKKAAFYRELDEFFEGRSVPS